MKCKGFTVVEVHLRINRSMLFFFCQFFAKSPEKVDSNMPKVVSGQERQRRPGKYLMWLPDVGGI